MIIQTPISVGELIDKITILSIKLERIADAAQLKNIQKEYNELNQVIQQHSLSFPQEQAELKKINETLWEVEDEIRDCERNQNFGEKFIELARKVYFTNDIRAEIKKAINLKAGSDLVEEKSYQKY